MKINKNNLDIPDYLNKEFFESTFKSGFNCKNVEIQSVDFTMGSAVGENYLSFIYRAEVTYVPDGSSPKKISLIIKSIPMDEAREIFAQLNIYGREKQMYLPTLPKMEECLDGFKLAPKCYYTVEEPIATMVFEDMGVPGYKTSDRITGLDEEHCKILLSKLGQYHASSMLLLKKDPQVREISELQEGLFSSFGLRSDLFNKSFMTNLEQLAEHTTKWPGFDGIAQKLRNMIEDEGNNRAIKTISVSPNDLVVLSHGDVWVNNILFKYKNKTPVDVVFVDFQGSCFGSLGLDINYFFNSSLNLDILKNKRISLIENSYYPSFRKALEFGGCKNIPSLDDIKNEIKKKAFFGFYALVAVLPFVAMDKEESSSNTIESFTDESVAEAKKKLACSGKRFIETAKVVLKEYNSAGILD